MGHQSGQSGHVSGSSWPGNWWEDPFPGYFETGSGSHWPRNTSDLLWRPYVTQWRSRCFNIQFLQSMWDYEMGVRIRSDFFLHNWNLLIVIMTRFPYLSKTFKMKISKMITTSHFRSNKCTGFFYVCTTHGHTDPVCMLLLNVVYWSRWCVSCLLPWHCLFNSLIPMQFSTVYLSDVFRQWVIV